MKRRVNYLIDKMKITIFCKYEFNSSFKIKKSRHIRDIFSEPEKNQITHVLDFIHLTLGGCPTVAQRTTVKNCCGNPESKVTLKINPVQHFQ